MAKLGEKLKTELRHSWLSNGRRESVAEHTWLTTLMAMTIEPYLPKKVNGEKLIKMLIIHDLVEIYATDIPAFKTMNSPEMRSNKKQNEIQAIEKIREILSDKNGQQFYDLWFEFEGKETYEAKVANALDKLEAQLQHNAAPIETWLPIEYKMTFMLGRHTDFDPVLSQLKEFIEDEGERKMKEAGINIDEIKY
ncbi:HD domain-containing protein [Paenibacillus polymyxa]|uniref:HD domain-containing protein n=1 Tax=Paenibacillus TaxID=44249 RepID=UPI0020B85900|nr:MULTISPECIES: HD domain-containing protein [Paenibacillus]MCP3781464.1 HD domain-containing protein [Paenibacillus sp. MZ03-122A]MDY7991005.1 HD domain-containing protein [Paenibacillus polymyxa]MDY8120116.1 HD domain-containing protein [Paenibacillus polymyxa]